MPLHSQWSSGLRSNGVLPSRIALDPVELGRPDNTDMELAEQISQSVFAMPE